MNGPKLLKEKDKPKRERSHPLSWWHKKAWDVFSKWVRERDGRCVTCGERDGLQAGHFWHAVLDFDEININAQCRRCNHFLSGNLAPYSAYLINKYGVEQYKKLEIRHYMAKRGEKRSVEDYKQIIERYTEKIENRKERKCQ